MQNGKSQAANGLNRRIAIEHKVGQSQKMGRVQALGYGIET
jgi:hypothetical protein